MTRKRSEFDVMLSIELCYTFLKPEHLTRDGELSEKESRQLKTELNDRLQVCFEELGRKVDETEAYNYIRNVNKVMMKNRA